jgi:hypothetical protein
VSHLKHKIYAIFDGGQSPKPLHELCLALISEQKKTWQELKEGYKLLKHIREREISCRGFSVRIQYNPGRIKSSLASVVEKNIKERPCFLCLNNLPESQKGILYRKKYLILCNPAPVLPSHFTISRLDHCPQAIAENINTFLTLIGDFGSGWVALYNGPKCGASAPDHLHFQAISAGQMPVEREILAEKRLNRIRQINGVQLSRAKGLGREVIILEGGDRTAVANIFKSFLKSLKKVLHTDEEPMMNIACFFNERKWRLFIFPRAKHRPEAFFRGGDNCIMVSPGVIEMGGVVVTPIERDFKRLNATLVEGIFREVSLYGKTIASVIKATA